MDGGGGGLYSVEILCLLLPLYKVSGLRNIAVVSCVIVCSLQALYVGVLSVEGGIERRRVIKGPRQVPRRARIGLRALPS